VEAYCDVEVNFAFPCPECSSQWRISTAIVQEKDIANKLLNGDVEVRCKRCGERFKVEAKGIENGKVCYP
jgi:predicted Zn finger-like uncharacterized protein